MGWSRRRGLICRQLVAQVSDYLDGALDAAQQRAFEQHLAACDGCAEYLTQFTETIRLVGEHWSAER